MRWDDIVRIPQWTPLRDLGAEFEPVLPCVFRLADNSYLITEYCGPAPEKGPGGAHYVINAMWADGDNAIRRALGKDETVAVQRSCDVPPPLLLYGSDASFEAIVRLIPVSGWRRSHGYEFSTSGILHHVIAIRSCKFCFSSSDPRPEERAYAIKVTLYPGESINASDVLRRFAPLTPTNYSLPTAAEQRRLGYMLSRV